eukprot:m.338870 g.338870  ORF g.338870 m.338870 type:complete len:284 (+) comp18572_c0_seq1:213-1064(+)
MVDEEYEFGVSPWHVLFSDPSHQFEWRVAVYMLLFLVFHFVVIYISPNWKNPIAERPTVVAGQVHAIITTLGAGVILYAGVDYYPIWGEHLIPFSCAYFMCDIIWFAIPNSAVVIFIHHLLISLCHCPLGVEKAALSIGLGDKNFCYWLSMVGYLAEFTTATTNVRWWITKTRKEHSIFFFTISALTLAGWIARIFMFAYLVIFELYPRIPAYKEKGYLSTISIALAGHIGTMLLSVYWVRVMLRKGVKSALVYRDLKRTESENMLFAAKSNLKIDLTPKKSN